MAQTRLFGLAALTLYLELALIRFAGAEILYLGYFANFILISVFLGVGLGFLAGRRKRRLFALAAPLLLGLLLFIELTSFSVLSLGAGLGQLYFNVGAGARLLPVWATMAVPFILVVTLFAAIGQETSRAFARLGPLPAYSTDILGSLAGIIVFTLQAQAGASPFFWFLLVFCLLALLLKDSPRAALTSFACGAAALALLHAHASGRYIRWSPYQKIEVVSARGGYRLAANGIGHQSMLRLEDTDAIYAYPYSAFLEQGHAGGYRQALIIGSGAGTDVAHALRNGVGAIDAVEIDPEILQAGRELHPLAPYSAPSVTATIDDGRAFMARAAATGKRYDLIIFALPDSLALLSSYSSIRLESFLFTSDAFRQARALLSGDGVLILYNFYREAWLVQKLAGMLHGVFGQWPRVHMYDARPGSYLATLAIGPGLAGEPPSAAPLEPATDDWPFLYMKERALPPLYALVMAFFVCAAAVGVRLVEPRFLEAVTGASRAGALPFFFMGAAFMLLETKSLVQFLLLFGATWLVNALVFSAILVSVLAANTLVARLKLRRPLLLALPLAASLALGFALPTSALLGIGSAPARYVLASLVFFSPIFFANLLFGALFQKSPKAELAYGWNLLGAMLGGTLEYGSVVTGYRGLTLVVAVLYGLALLTARGRSRGSDSGNKRSSSAPAPRPARR